MGCPSHGNDTAAVKTLNYISGLICSESLPGIFEAAGFGAVKRYRYWNGESRKVCVEEMTQDLENAPGQSVVVLSASGHCPTGADLSQEEWKRVTEVLVVLYSTV